MSSFLRIILVGSLFVGAYIFTMWLCGEIFPSSRISLSSSWILVKFFFVLIPMPACFVLIDRVGKWLHHTEVTRAIHSKSPVAIKNAVLTSIKHEDYSSVRALIQASDSTAFTQEVVSKLDRVDEAIGSGAFQGDGWAALDTQSRFNELKVALKNWADSL